MALVVLARNDEDPERLANATAVCGALEAVGERPVLFFQGTHLPAGLARFPGKCVLSLADADERVKRQVAWEIQSVVELSSPAVLVEAARPCPIRLPSRVRRILLVQPLAFDEVRRLQASYGDVYSAFALCDTLESPSSRYSEAEIAALRTWDRWHVVGAIPTHGAGVDAHETWARRLQQLVLGAPARSQVGAIVAAASPAAVPRPAARRRRLFPAAEVPLVVRVDDVVSLDAPLRWLLEALAARGLHASLEVVPYLTTLDEASLGAFDAAGLFEVAQHGFAHVPHTVDGRRYEFAPSKSSAPDLPSDERVIASGKARLEALFPTRFRGGFSAPFDGLPGWLPPLWSRLGGAFISSLRALRAESPLPLVRAGVDVWHWRRLCGFDPAQVLRKMRVQSREDGHAGLVLHAHRYEKRAERARLLRLLDQLLAEGFRSVRLHERAFAPPPERSFIRSLAGTLRTLVRPRIPPRSRNKGGTEMQ